MNVTFYSFAILYTGSIGATLFSYFAMRQRANKNLPPEEQLPFYVGDRWGFMQPLSTYYSVTDEFRRQFPNSPLPEICAWSVVVSLLSLPLMVITGF